MRVTWLDEQATIGALYPALRSVDERSNGALLHSPPTQPERGPPTATEPPSRHVHRFAWAQLWQWNCRNRQHRRKRSSGVWSAISARIRRQTERRRSCPLADHFSFVSHTPPLCWISGRALSSYTGKPASFRPRRFSFHLREGRPLTPCSFYCESQWVLCMARCEQEEPAKSRAIPSGNTPPIGHCTARPREVTSDCVI